MTTSKIPTFLKAAGLAVLLLFASCWGRNRNVIPERKFIAFLVDLHIVEAIGTQSKGLPAIEYAIDSASLYGSVFRKHNVSQAMLDSTLIYYSRRPDKFMKIYGNVSLRLQTMEQALIREEKARDSARTEVIWKSDSTYVFRKGGDKVEIIVPLSGPGLYTVSANVKMMPDDASLDPRMSVSFWKDDGTEEGKSIRFMDVRYILRNGHEKTYRASRTLDSTSYTYIRGYIANYSNADTIFRRNMVIKDIEVTRQKELEK
jgi:hypothetical protein